MSEEFHHTWFYKKILEKYKSYQDFANAIHYTPNAVYTFVVAYVPPSDSIAEHVALMFELNVEEVKDYMLDDYDKNKKHRAETGDYYFTAKLEEKDKPRVTDIVIAGREYQAVNGKIARKGNKNRGGTSPIQRYLDEIEQTSDLISDLFPQEILIDKKEVELYQKGIRKGLKIAVEILSRDSDAHP